MERADLWTTEQPRTFLSAAAGHRIGAFYRLAAHTGARRGELTHMRRADLDLDATELTITGSAATRTWWQDGDDLVFLREDGARCIPTPRQR